jgi:hypothetical protein
VNFGGSAGGSIDPDIPAAILDGQALGTARTIEILDGAFNHPVEGF